MNRARFGVDGWPWQRGSIRLLPALHDRLEFARAVRAHLDAFDPEEVVVEIPRPAGEAWLRAVAALPEWRAVRLEQAGRVSWIVPAPADPLVEAARWALERGRPVTAGDAAVGRYGAHRDPLPDPAVLPEVGYRAFVERLVDAGAFPRDARDEVRACALADAARRAAKGGRRVALVIGLAHLEGVLAALERGGAPPLVPLARPAPLVAGVLPLDPDSLAEVLGDPPFVQLAWERARRGEPPACFERPGRRAEPAAVLRFPNPASAPPAPPALPAAAREIEEEEERGAAARGEDLLARPRLIYRLVQQAARHARVEGSPEPSLAERRVLHTFARNLALLEGRLCPDLYELIVAARGAVDDRFARDLLALAGHWPWPAAAGGIRLAARDLGLGSRLVTLRPRIDRLARRPSLRDALREAVEGWQGSGICSYPPEDVLVEALGTDLRERGAARDARAGLQVVPFVASLLDGLDARETMRHRLTDGRPWVRDEVRAQGEVGSVVVIWEDEEIFFRGGAPSKYPWTVTWHGEHQNESDMAFFATDPGPGATAPGIHRAEYGGFMLTWPPLRLGEVWSDPSYRFCRTKGEKLLVAAADYSEKPLVVFVAPRAPRPEIVGLARRLGRRIVHLRPGMLSPDRLRRLRTLHVLAGRHLRPLARWVVPER